MPSPGAIFSPIANERCVGGDQRGAVRRHEAAQDRAAGLHEFGGDHDVDVAGRRHQRQDRLAAVARRHHLDVVDRGAGALGDAGHRGRLRDPALALGELRRSSRPARRRPGRPSRGSRCEIGRSVASTCGGERPVGPSRPSCQRLERRTPAVAPPLQPADHGACATLRLELIPAGRIVNDVGAIERRAQHGGFRDLAAIAAADAGIVDRRDRIVLAADRRCCLTDSDGQPDRRMQAWSPVQTSSSTPKRSLDHALAVLDRLVEQRLHAALLVQHAFGGGDDDLRALRPWSSAPPSACRASCRRRRCGRSGAPIWRRCPSPP